MGTQLIPISEILDALLYPPLSDLSRATCVVRTMDALDVYIGCASVLSNFVNCVFITLG